MDKRFRNGEDDPSVITEMNVLAVLLYAQGKMDQVGYSKYSTAPKREGYCCSEARCWKPRLCGWLGVRAFCRFSFFVCICVVAPPPPPPSSKGVFRTPRTLVELLCRFVFVRGWAGLGLARRSPQASVVMMCWLGKHPTVPPLPRVSSARQAEPLLRKVLALREKVLGADHVDAAESLVNLAVLNNKKVRGNINIGNVGVPFLFSFVCAVCGFPGT